MNQSGDANPGDLRSANDLHVEAMHVPRTYSIGNPRDVSIRFARFSAFDWFSWLDQQVAKKLKQQESNDTTGKFTVEGSKDDEEKGRI